MDLIKVRAYGLATKVAGFARRAGHKLVATGQRAATSIHDGYLLRAKRFDKFITVDVIDPPTALVHRIGTADADPAVADIFYNGWVGSYLGRGRDAVLPDWSEWESPIEPASWYATGVRYSPQGTPSQNSKLTVSYFGALTPSRDTPLVTACTAYTWHEVTFWFSNYNPGLDNIFVRAATFIAGAVPAAVARNGGGSTGLVTMLTDDQSEPSGRSARINNALLEPHGLCLFTSFQPGAYPYDGIQAWITQAVPPAHAVVYRQPAPENSGLSPTTRVAIAAVARRQLRYDDPCGVPCFVFLDWLRADPNDPDFGQDAGELVYPDVVHVDDVDALSNAMSRSPRLVWSEEDGYWPRCSPWGVGVPYLALVGPGRFACVLRHMPVAPQYDNPVDDDWRFWIRGPAATVRVLWLSPGDPEGPAVVEETVVDPELPPPFPGEPPETGLYPPIFDFQERWFCRGLGMDSDGTTAVYVGCFDWREKELVEDPDNPGHSPPWMIEQGKPWQSDFGVLVITDGHVTKHHFPDPGFWAYHQLPERKIFLAVANHGEEDEEHVAVTLPTAAAQETGQLNYRSVQRNGLVTYIGNGKFVFPVVVGTRNPDADDEWPRDSPNSLPNGDPLVAPYVGPVTFALAQFDLNAPSTLTLLGNVHTIPAAMYAMENGYVNYPVGVGPVWCVQREIADDQGNVTKSATLLIDFADSTRGEIGWQVNPNASTAPRVLVSYDSGQTWRAAIRQYATGWGVAFGGSATFAPKAGALEIDDTIETED